MTIPLGKFNRDLGDDLGDRVSVEAAPDHRRRGVMAKINRSEPTIPARLRAFSKIACSVV